LAAPNPCSGTVPPISGRCYACGDPHGPSGRRAQAGALARAFIVLGAAFVGTNEWGDRMSKFFSICITTVVLLGGSAAWLMLAAKDAQAQAIPNFAPDNSTAWTSDRPASDDFLPPASGPGPVLSDKAHPYVPNGQGQSTYRVADLTNPILQPWVVEQMRKTNEEVLAGKVPFIARERCWPAGVPGLNIYNRGQPVHFIQTQEKVVIINELYAQIRHVYLNVPHSAHPTPSWYGESVGHYEGDELVVDTIGLDDRTFVDNYRTPHTDQLHVVERFKMIDGGKSLQVTVTVDDPGAFNMPWSAIQHWRRIHQGLIEDLCEPNNNFFFGYEVAPLPHADTPDF
jgi:hypothetical protein